ncbi:enoyl-CoA hydratase/isomerase family protein [Alcaligenaceae bacterium CGII-47]|nr:enoyl-CoA hydratase/isomerase family protein [Alcaligenaceae bacterium CGII-47]
MNASDKAAFFKRDGAIGYLVIDNPSKRNAINYSMWTAIPDLVRQADTDPSVRVIVLRGAGENAFAAGADINEFETMFATSQGCRDYHDAIRKAEQTLGTCSKPTIAMIHGFCIGGGMELALACDLRFASDDGRFGVTASKLGVVYSLTSTRRLMQLIGPSRTRDLLYSGRLLDASEAAAMGIVDRILSAADLERETVDYARTLCQRAPRSIAASKRIVEIILNGAHDETTASERLRLDAFAGDELAEGIRAFKARRQPDFLRAKPEESI